VADGAKRVRERERTISFYEIVSLDKDGNGSRTKQISWSKHLEKLEKVKLGDRVSTAGPNTLIGEVISHNGEMHLKLMKVRDEDSWMGIYNPSAQSVNDLNLGNDALLETSIICFLGYGNVIGMIRGSTSAPTPGLLAEWINGISLLTSEVDVDPLMSAEAKKKLSVSSETSRVEARIHTSKAEALEARGSKLSGLLKTIRQEYGPMTVTVILQASRAKAQSEGRKTLRKEAGKLEDAAAHHEVESAKAKLIYIDADEEATTEEVNFVKQKITAKRKIATTADDGSPIRNRSAIDAILAVAGEHDAELRKIVGA
jgi:hypothetical protein